MDHVNGCQHPQVPDSTQLGNFEMLPPEIRLLIWECLFYEIHRAPHVLSILHCSRYLYQEISDHLYKGMRHGIRISGADDTLKWLYVRLFSNRMSVKWRGLKNIKAVRKHLQNFPHGRIEGKEIFLNVILSQKDPDQIIRLREKAHRFVDILKAAPVTPIVRVGLLEENPPKTMNYTNELPHDYKLANIPFMCLSNWHCRVSVGLSAVVTNKRESPGRSLLDKPTEDDGLNDSDYQITTGN